MNHAYYASLRWGTYTGISFLTTLACVIPITRMAVSLVIFGYTSYTCFCIFRDYTEIEKDGRGGKRGVLAALAVNGQELIYLVLALMVGLVVGLGS